MKLIKFIIIMLSFGLFSSPIAILLSQDYRGNKQLTEEELQLQVKELKANKAKLTAKLNNINNEIDNLKQNSIEKSKQIENSEGDLYSLVETTKSIVDDFRKKFEETEKMINYKLGTIADARKNFDELTNDKAHCLPEFQDRYAAMKKKLEDWEGPRIADSFQVPEATSRDLLPIGKFRNHTFQEVADIIQSTLMNNGYPENKYYRVPGGFAIVSKVEQIHEDGYSYNGNERFSSYISTNYNFWEILKHTFINYNSRWRTFVFIVTNEIIDYSNIPNESDIRIYSRNGQPDLQSVGVDINTICDTNYKVHILAYEYTKEINSENPLILSNNQTTIFAQEHLRKAGMGELLR